MSLWMARNSIAKITWRPFRAQFETGSLNLSGSCAYQTSSWVPESHERLTQCQLWFTTEAFQIYCNAFNNYIPSSFCATRLFPIFSRATARLSTEAELPSLLIHSYNISLAFSRDRLWSVSILTRIEVGSFSLIPRSCQHVPISSHIFKTCIPVTVPLAISAK